MRRRIAVIGGGISGLAAAVGLAKSEHDTEVLLLESSNRLGGVIDTTHRDGFMIESAADNFLVHPSSAVKLCEEIGLGQELVTPDHTRRKAFVVHDDRLQPIPDGFLLMSPSKVWPILSTPVLSWKGKLRLMAEAFIPPRRDDADESLASFARRRLGSEVFEHLVQPLVGGIYTGNPERLSINATMPRFRSMERESGSLIRAALRKRKQPTSQRDESGSRGGARYGSFVAPRGGMSSLIQRLENRLPPQSIRLNWPVDSVLPLEQGRWMISSKNADQPPEFVDAVIVAAPAHHAAKMLSEFDAALSRELQQIEYSSCAIVALAYRRDQIHHNLDGFGFVVPLVEQRSILACNFSSVKYPGRAPEDTVLMRVFIGGDCQAGLLRLAYDDLIRLAQLEVSELLGIRGAPLLSQIKRHCNAMPQYNIGHQARVAKIQQMLTPTIALAGSAFYGVGVPACVQSGQTAADQILAATRSRTDYENRKPQTAS